MWCACVKLVLGNSMVMIVMRLCVLGRLWAGGTIADNSSSWLLTHACILPVMARSVHTYFCFMHTVPRGALPSPVNASECKGVM